jgi:NAD(P)-dependent dehydrogenase (short-subunit alcohol dehydrogenase family)
MNMLQGKVACVTGGSGGQGLAISEADAYNGAVVGIGPMSPASIEIATAVIHASGGLADGFPGNSAELDQLQILAQQTIKPSGQSAFRVNSAGIGTPVRPTIRITPHVIKTSD